MIGKGAFSLALQKPKPKKIAEGALDISKDAHFSLIAVFFDDDERAVAELREPRIVHASSMGIKLVGFEPDGCDKKGRLKFKYQEWWLVHL